MSTTLAVALMSTGRRPSEPAVVPLDAHALLKRRRPTGAFHLKVGKSVVPVFLMTKPIAEFARSHPRPASAANRCDRVRHRVAVVHGLPFDAQLSQTCSPGGLKARRHLKSQLGNQ